MKPGQHLRPSKQAEKEESPMNKGEATSVAPGALRA